MNWVKFSDRWPTQQPAFVSKGIVSTPTDAYYDPDKFIVRGPHFEGERIVQYCLQSVDRVLHFTDCTHPTDNRYFDPTKAEWLED